MTPANLWHARRGNVTILFAGGLAMLLAVAALAVDTGSIFLEKRRLQGIADAAALAAAGDPATGRAAAQAAIDANAHVGATLRTLVFGAYLADPAVAPAARFQPGTNGDAAQVTVGGSVPTFFARFFSNADATPLSAQATAARSDLAAFAIGSRVAAVQGGLANALLSALAGADLRLSSADYTALVAGRIDVLAFAQALRAAQAGQAATAGDALNAQVSVRDVLRALAAATTDTGAAATLRAIAGKVPDQSIRPADIVDLGPLGTNNTAESGVVTVDAYSIVRAVLELGNDRRQANSDGDLGIPGLASATVRVAIGERAQHSPWLAVSAARKVTVRTAQTRLYLDAQLTAAPAGLGSMRVPLYVELAPAEATLAAVSCAAGRNRPTATLDVSVAPGRIVLADIDASRLDDFSKPMPLRPAALVTTPLATVTGYGDLPLGGVTTQAVFFTSAEIAAHTPKTVTSDDVARGIVTGLVARTSLRVTVLGLGIDTGTLTGTVGGLLTGAAGPLDQLLAQVSALSGVRLGQADVWIDGVRCGVPTLIG